MPHANKVVRPWIKPSKPRNQRWSNEAKGGVPNQFYRNAPWRKLRQSWLEEHPLCERCRDVLRRLTPATVVDHIKPIRLGGEPLDESNLMSLCKSCHARKSGSERHIPDKPARY